MRVDVLIRRRQKLIVNHFYPRKIKFQIPKRTPPPRHLGFASTLFPTRFLLTVIIPFFTEILSKWVAEAGCK